MLVRRLVALRAPRAPPLCAPRKSRVGAPLVLSVAVQQAVGRAGLNTGPRVPSCKRGLDGHDCCGKKVCVKKTTEREREREKPRNAGGPYGPGNLTRSLNLKEGRERERERECKIPLYNLDSESNLDMRSILNPLKSHNSLFMRPGSCPVWHEPVLILSQCHSASLHP